MSDHAWHGFNCPCACCNGFCNHVTVPEDIRAVLLEDFHKYRDDHETWPDVPDFVVSDDGEMIAWYVKDVDGREYGAGVPAR